VIENCIIYLVFWIHNECIHIETKKIISTEYLIRSIRSFMQCFLGILDIALIRWISLQGKTAFFVGQNLNAKNYTYFGTEGVSYTTYGPNSTKPSKEAPNAKESFSPSLLAARPEPPWLRVRPRAPPVLGFEPSAFGPRPFACPLDRRLVALRRPASGSLILITSPTRQRQLRQG